LQELLSAGHANYNGRDIFHIDERIEKFRARQIRKMDDAVGNLRDFASHVFARSQVQLHTLADGSLKDAEDGRIRLQGNFFLGEQTGAGHRRKDDSKKKRVTFHDQLVCVISDLFASK